LNFIKTSSSYRIAAGIGLAVLIFQAGCSGIQGKWVPVSTRSASGPESDPAPIRSFFLSGDSVKTAAPADSVKPGLSVQQPDSGRQSHRTGSDSVSARSARPDSLIKPPVFSLLRDSLKTPGKPDSLSADSLKQKKPKTLLEKLADSLNYVADSTARLEQFKFQRQQKFVPDPGQDLKYGLFLNAPSTIKKNVEVDSMLQQVTITEKMGDLVLKGPVSMPYQDYVAERFAQNTKDTWQALTGTKSQVKRADAIEALFSKITNVDIYVPGGGGALFRTIFGPPKINIRVNGSIDIKAGWATNTNSNASAYAGKGSQNDPVFDQQFQMNVQGTVGDKLQISADWSTQRTFEYENSLKIVYTGYEDEIVQKVEAGNVSLTTPTKYVQGSSALFGIKSTMQLGPLTWTFLVSQQKGKTESKTISGGSQSNAIEIAASQYDFDKHFFLSRYFRENYDTIFSNPPLMYVTGYNIIQAEVWKQRVTTTGKEDERQAVAILKLGENEPLLPETTYQAPGGPGNAYRGLVLADTYERVLEKIRSGELAPQDSKFPTTEYVSGRFVKLQEGIDYTLDKSTGIIHFNTQGDPNAAYAIAYSIQRGTEPASQVGDFSITGSSSASSKSNLILKLIRPAEIPNPNNQYAWDLMLKNIYKLPSSDFGESDLELEVKYEYQAVKQSYLPGGSSVNLIEILNLDRLGANNSGTKDNKFDFIEKFTVDSKRGEIILPSLRPFDSWKLRTAVNGLSLAEKEKADLLFEELYDTNFQALKSLKTKDKYYFTGKVKGSISNRYNLGFNIVEGSVKVLNNGIPLTPNVDYEVDYQMGSILIKNTTYLTSGSNLSIQYESNDLFTLASKNFMGSRFDLDLTQKLKLGFSWLRYSEKPLTDKVRIGDEPKLNNIIGMDGKWETNSRFLTRLVNYLPGVRTSATSTVSLSGEIAQIIPGHPTELNTDLDPNGVAYIDDFEGSRKSTTLGVTYTNWSISSAPVMDESKLAVYNPFNPDSSVTNYRALLRFYNDLGARVPIQEIWPERSVSSRDNTISTFSLEYFPKKRGPYNFSTRLDQTIYSTNGETWGGIQRAVPSYITNLVDENIEFIEFWVQVSDDKLSPGVFTATDTGYLYIDLGYISEDILPDNQLNSELGVSQQNSQSVWGKYPTGSSSLVFSKNDDNGIDGLTDTEEKVFYQPFISALSSVPIPDEEKTRILEDISGDNYGYSQGSYNYSAINGSEGNTRTEGSQDRLYPDTEDLNSNFSLDDINEYFQYKIPIHPDSLKAGAGYVVSGNESSKWYQFRIPLKDWHSKVGSIKDLSFTKFIRLWLTGFKKDVYFQFASLDFVGSQWLKESKDSVVSIAVINIEENPDKYDSPPGIERQKDRTRPDENIRLNEQSLEIKFRGLKEGQERSIVKTLSQPLNITNYDRLKMFVHGPDADPAGEETPVGYQDTSNYDAEIFLRFGSDSKNYYEIALPLHPDKRKTTVSNATWDPANTFDIDLARLTALKQLKKATDTSLVQKSPAGYPEGATVTLKGSPTLTLIKQFNIGVRNPKNKGTIQSLSFSIWVNELRVSGFKEETGWAANTAVSLTLADLAKVNFVIEKQTAEFRRVSDDASQNKANTVTWSVQGSLAADKFLGEKPIINLPISVSHTESVAEPKYLSGSDVLLEEAASLAGDQGDKLIDLNRSVTVSNTFTLSQVRKQIPSSNPLLRTTLDRLSFDFSYSNDFTRNPTVEWSRGWRWNSKIDYSYQFKPDFFLQPLAVPMAAFKSDFLYLNKWLDEATVKDWSETKLFLKPTSFNWNVSFDRSRSQSKNRAQALPSEASRQFNAKNGFGLVYQVTDNLTLNANGSVSSVLTDLLLDTKKQERPETEILGDLFTRAIRLDFGRDLSYNQAVTVAYKIPFLKVMNLTSQYSAQYAWVNPNSSSSAATYSGNTVSWQNTLTLGSSFRLGEIFGIKQDAAKPALPAKQAKTDTLSLSDKMLRDLSSVARAFLSLDAITIRFNQSNAYSTNGVAGGSGILNFFPFNQDWWPDPLRLQRPGELPGPGLKFQLGLTTDPGPRAKFDTLSKVILTEKYGQQNGIDWKTGFQPAEKIKVELSWKVQWNISKESKLDSKTLLPTQTTSAGGFTRSFIGIMGDFEEIRKNLPTNPATGFYILGNNEITAAFRDGLELFQLSKPLTNALGLGIWDIPASWQDLMPLPNWSVQVSGLEKFPLWASIVQTMSMTHSYTGEYQTTYSSRPDAGKEITDPDTQEKYLTPRIEYGSPRLSERFSPLIGFNISFKKPFTSRININKGRTMTLSTVSRQVQTQNNTEISASISYTQSGSSLLSFWPFNGNTLKNDLDFSVTGSYAVDETKIESLSGKTSPPAQGINRLSLEPRVGYAISTRVNASAFWRYTQSKPITGSLSSAEISRSEIGVNVHIGIQ